MLSPVRIGAHVRLNTDALRGVQLNHIKKLVGRKKDLTNLRVTKIIPEKEEASVKVAGREFTVPVSTLVPC